MRARAMIGAMLLAPAVAWAQPTPAPTPAPQPVPVTEPEPEPEPEAVPVPDAETEPVTEPEDDEKKDKKKKKDKDKGADQGDGADGADKKDKDEKDDPLRISGRVVVREQLESEADGPWTGEMSLEDVRLDVRWRKKKRLDVVVELSAAGSFKLKDAFIRLRVIPDLWVRAGHFKMPVSSIEQTSKWKLPSIDRGLLSDILDNGIAVAGRRVGAAVEWGPDHALLPVVIAGAYQSRDLNGVSNEGFLDGDQAGLDVAARAGITPTEGLEVAVVGSSRLGQTSTPDARTRFWATGVDAILDRGVGDITVRTWIDLLVGTSPLDTTPATPEDPMFMAARAIVSARRGGIEDNTWFVEPYALASVFDINLDNTEDLIFEGGLGVATGRWDRWRVQFQGGVQRTGDNLPITVTGGLTAPADKIELTLQLGAVF